MTHVKVIITSQDFTELGLSILTYQKIDQVNRSCWTSYGC